MENWENTNHLNIVWVAVTDSDEGAFFKVGVDGVTRIENINKNG